jgi:hypothetical protein
LRRTILIVVVLLLIAVPAYAQYNIHLKNGSVIRGVPSYKEVDGELRFSYLGGTLGIPLDDVLKVEEARTGDVEIAPHQRGQRSHSPSHAGGSTRATQTPGGTHPKKVIRD